MYVADVGCGPGNIARLLKGQGCTVVGIDSNVEALKAAQEYCTRTVVADLDRDSLSTVLQGEHFDVIVFADVLEHLRDPRSTLTASKALLREGGFVVASIPNIAHGAIRLSLLLGTFHYQPLGIMDDTHLRFFTRKTVEALFEECGFAIETLERTALPVLSNSPLIPKLNENDFPPGLLAAIESADEAETLQFVLKARPLEVGAKSDVQNDYVEQDEHFRLALRGAFPIIDAPAIREAETRRQWMRDLEERYFALEEAYRNLEGLRLDQDVLREQLKKVTERDELSRRRLIESRTEIAALRDRINQIETSRFWRIRNLFMRILRKGR
jgi:O-antigen biosynthesis protein